RARPPPTACPRARPPPVRPKTTPPTRAQHRSHFTMATTKKDDNGEDGVAEGPEDDRPMSFFDHLTELRMRLMRASLALVGGFILCYAFVDDLTQMLLK